MKLRFLLSCLLLAVPPAVLLPALPLAAQSGGPPPAEGVAEVVAAERAFAARSVADGVRTAFLTYLAPDAIVFRPGPVLGRPVYAGYVGQGTLAWTPRWAGLAADADLGFTSGPWFFTPRGAERPAGFGHYVSVWRRDADAWRVVLDVGIAHAAPDTAAPLAYAPAGLPADSAAAAAGLAAAEEAPRRAAPGAYARAFAAAAVPAARLYRTGALPATGPQAAALLASPAHALADWQVQAAHLARTGDLGYTYGTATFEDGRPGAFAHLWQHTADGWRLLIDLAVPLPEAREE